MKYLILLLLLPILSFSQNKGASPIANSQQPTANKNTYAVVIGISDYQDAAIPDLRYADKDAEAFANFLRSPAGGSLDGDHLKVLTNEMATAGRIAEALDGLIEQAKEGDQVIIYFSGHGDVEGKKISQPGFLLAWDAPSRVYMGGGTYSLSFLQEVITTLTVQSKAKVMVITDACHAGKLAGSQIGGAQLTTANLAKQYANEVKILSCQPNEFSIEGPQWGGGRGVFSYHLVDGLFGLADRNNDGQVTLGEIDRYLEDHVTEEAAPQSQVPILMGNKTDKLASVNSSVLEELKKNKTGNMTVLAAAESRGLEDDVLAKLDSGIVKRFFAFKKAVAEKRFFDDAYAGGSQPSADELYTSLSVEPGLAPLYGFLKRNYAAALQDDAQQVLNIMLKSGLTSEVLSDAKAAKIYRSYPAYLDRAAELLGSGHYMYAALKARKHYFEGTLKIAKSEKKQQFFQALHWQADMPHAYAALIGLYPAEHADSAEYYTARAMQIVPAWVKPYLDLSKFYQNAKLPNKAEEMLNRASQLDSGSILVWYKRALFYQDQKKYDAAEYWYVKAIAGAGTDICFPCAYLNLGHIYADTHRYAEAEQQYKRAIQLDPNFTYAYNGLGLFYAKIGRYAEAEQQFKKAIQLDSNYTYGYNSLGKVYIDIRRNNEAEQQFKKAIQLDSTYAMAYYNLGHIYADARRYPEAEQQYKKAIQLDSALAIAYINLGAIYCDVFQRYFEAEGVFKKAIQLDSTYANAYNNLGIVYANTSRYAEAEQQFKNAILLDSNYALAYNYLGIVYANTRRFAEAEQQYKKSIQLDSTFAKAYNNLGIVYANTSRYVEAVQQYKKAIQLDSTRAIVFYNLACMYSRLNLPELAYEQLEQALRKGYNNINNMQQDEDFALLKEQNARWKSLVRKTLVPDTTDAKGWFNLGNLYIQNSQYAEAEPVLKKAIALDTTVAPAHYLLGKVYFKTKRPDEARLEFLKTIELNSQARMARLGMAWLLTVEGKNTEALDWVAQAIEKGGAPFDVLQSDEDLAPLRATPEWKALMKKHFPEKIKD